ncbi:MAG TPA: glycerol-3-phosphate dehydrogenase/oxidase [Gammaproteobacteria bacterium]|nr:glycerol-3-phosphate dehydrogenase/oxidase [Gammaproteobacteria bacterium]
MSEPLQRDLNRLSTQTFDLLVVGGGIFGICAAWDAVLRGLEVALIEACDFGHGASANCFKMVHGGIRYLQHGDVYRLRHSARERKILLQIAPHLVKPLPVVVPTYGHGKEGKEFLGVGIKLYDWLTMDRNRGVDDPARQVPSGSFLSRNEVLADFPGLEQKGLTGAAKFYDGQMYNTARLVLAFLRSATTAGLCAANYVRAQKILTKGGQVSGVDAVDELTGDAVTIHARTIINASGGWSEALLGRSGGLQPAKPSTFSRDACFIVPRIFDSPCALAAEGRTKDPDAILSRSARHLFIVPWRQYSLVGVWHVVDRGSADEVRVSEADLQGFLDEINGAYPALQLTHSDVNLWNAGQVLFGENAPEQVNLSYGKRSRMIDHWKTHQLQGLVTLIGVRYTTARVDAIDAVNLVVKKLQRKAPAGATASRRVFGGAIDDIRASTRQAVADFPTVNPDIMDGVVQNYGSEYRQVMNRGSSVEDLQLITGTHTLIAEVRYAARQEMAMRLDDVVMRRTDMGSGEYPGRAALEQTAALLAQELSWSPVQQRQEITRTLQHYEKLTLRELTEQN